MDNASHSSMTIGNGSCASGCTNPHHMISFKELEQQLIEQVTLSVLRNDVDDNQSLDSGFQDFNNVSL